MLYYLQIAGTAIGAAIILFLLAKIMGEKQISQLSFFDYVTGITIGSIAAELATELENPLKPLLAMVIFGLIDIIVSVLTNKSIILRKLLAGKPVFLLDNGKLFRENFKKSRLDLNEFLMKCRLAGYFDLSQIKSAMLEHNGDISFLPITANKPVQLGDLSIDTPQENVCTAVIIDGEILNTNLKKCGKDAKWLSARLKEQGFNAEHDIFLAYCNSDNTLVIYK